MRWMKGSLVGLVLAGILALAPHLGVSHMVEEAAATVEEVDMVEASVVAVILALAGARRLAGRRRNRGLALL